MKPMMPRGRNSTTAITIRPKIENRSSLKSRRNSSSSTTITAPTTGPSSVPFPPASTMMIIVIMKEKPNTSGPTNET